MKKNITWRETANPLEQRFRSFCSETAGPTASEYAVMLALLIITVMVSINVLGASVTGSFTNIDGNIAAAAAGGGGGGGDDGGDDD